jgi:hypothetical protein
MELTFTSGRNTQTLELAEIYASYNSPRATVEDTYNRFKRQAKADVNITLSSALLGQQLYNGTDFEAMWRVVRRAINW